jgi:hypothetical protein
MMKDAIKITDATSDQNIDVKKDVIIDATSHQNTDVKKDVIIDATSNQNTDVKKDVTINATTDKMRGKIKSDRDHVTAASVSMHHAPKKDMATAVFLLAMYHHILII